MTNLQALTGNEEALQSSRLSTRLLRLLPLGAGGLVGLVLLGAWVIPTLQRLNEANQRLTQKLQKTAQVPLLRQQLQQTREEEQRVGVQRSQLLALITGSGDMSTFLAQVDREAQRHGVQLDVLEPAGAAAAAVQRKGAAAKQQEQQQQAAQAAAAADPLSTAGLESESLTLAVRGDFPSLLAFMRAIERLSLLVRQSDLELRLPENKRQRQQQAVEVQPPTELRFKVTLYGPRPPAASAPPAPSQPGAQPAP